MDTTYGMISLRLAYYPSVWTFVAVVVPDERVTVYRRFGSIQFVLLFDLALLRTLKN